MAPFGRKKIKTLTEQLFYSIIPIITHKEFLLNTKMATDVLNLAKFHQIKSNYTYNMSNEDNILWQS